MVLDTEEAALDGDDWLLTQPERRHAIMVLDGTVLTVWVSPEVAQLARQELALTATPQCTDTCYSEYCSEYCWSTDEIDWFSDETDETDEISNRCSASCRSWHSPTSDGVCNDGGLGTEEYSKYSYCPLGSDTADCGCRNGTTVADWLPPLSGGGWSERWNANVYIRPTRSPFMAGRGMCGTATIFAGISLLFLPCALYGVCKELAMMRSPRYVRRKSDGRTGNRQIAPPDRSDMIRVRWDDDGTASVEAAGDFETLSFEAHVGTLPDREDEIRV